MPVNECKCLIDRITRLIFESIAGPCLRQRDLGQHLGPG